jgi:hypothetical protein
MSRRISPLSLYGIALRPKKLLDGVKPRKTKSYAEK